MTLAASINTRPRFEQGVAVVMRLTKPMPEKYDSKRFGSPDDKGLILKGNVVEVIGNPSAESFPQKKGDLIDILLRPDDSRQKIFDDIVLTQEATRFVIDGVTMPGDTILGRWISGAGQNREITALEIVGPPSIQFENPTDSGPGWMRINMDGTSSKADTLIDGHFVERKLSFDEGVALLDAAYKKKLRFRVCQQVFEPSAACSVIGQDELETMMSNLRDAGYTNNIVRTFIRGTTDSSKVDLQYLGWPQDIPASDKSAGKTYDMPMLRDTPRFAALRDGEEAAEMELIPGYEMELIGNADDPSKSQRDKFVQDIIKYGLTQKQKNMYASQAYGPGMSIRAKNEQGDVLGLIKLAIRVNGPQYSTPVQIPTEQFPDAPKLILKRKGQDDTPESGA